MPADRWRRELTSGEVLAHHLWRKSFGARVGANLPRWLGQRDVGGWSDSPSAGQCEQERLRGEPERQAALWTRKWRSSTSNEEGISRQERMARELLRQHSSQSCQSCLRAVMQNKFLA